MRDQLPCRIDFTFTSQRDGGMYEGIHNGFKLMAIPEDAMMGWCNSDDVIWQGSLSYVHRVGREFPEVRWLTGWSTAFDELSRFKWLEQRTFFPRQILAAGLANGSHWPHLQQESTFWRKSLWDEAGGVDKSFKLAGDWDLWRRFAILEELLHVDRQLGAFYFRKGQKSSDLQRYVSECEARREMRLRIEDYKRMLAVQPTLSVSRVTADANDILRRRVSKLEPKALEMMRLHLLSPSGYFRKLRRRQQKIQWMG